MSERTRKSRRLPSEVVARFLAPLGEKPVRTAGWDRLPPKLGLAALVGIR